MSAYRLKIGVFEGTGPVLSKILGGRPHRPFFSSEI